MDLKFPHHENEIAQSEAASGQRYVNVWMHNGFVQVNKEKMAKSLGNFFTVREVLQRYQPEVVRLFILSSHYRGPLDYSDDNLDQAKAALTRLYTALRGLPVVNAPVDERWQTRFAQAMDDDFNTPEALAALFELAREINRLRGEDETAAAQFGSALKQLGELLGLLQGDPETFLSKRRSNDPSPLRHAEPLLLEQIETLIARAHRRPQGQKLGGSGSDSRPVAGGGHRAGGYRQGHDLAAGVTMRSSPSRKRVFRPQRSQPAPD